ncbi:MAG TPA: FGGY-family carbohydrate kinase [Acetobacteraceae bacterium]|nr:FGGY-family carbohydrate kinase [Acetobacteraceae bacterium]
MASVIGIDIGTTSTIGVLLLPYFLGEKSPIHDPDARGTITGLSLGHSAGHVWRAALEGTAYAFRHHVEVFRAIGYPVTRLLASDGGSTSAVWMQIVADVLGAPVQLLTGHPGSSLGAAWLAAIGAGVTDDWQGVARLTGHGALVEPDPACAAIYDEGFARFRSLYPALRPWFAAAAR